MASIIKVDQIQTASGGTPTAADLGLNVTGGVLQVVQSGASSDSVLQSSGTWTNTSLLINVTPSSTSSKILITGSVAILLGGNGSVMRGSIKVTRSINGGVATDVWNTDEFIEQFQVRNATNEHNTIGAIAFLDSPNTTDSVVYRVMQRYNGDSGTYAMRVWGSGRGSRLIAQEIAG